MITAALLLFCAGGAELTAFHPPEADVYLEVPDVEKLVVQLRSAPAARFVDDPDVQKLGALTQQLGYDLGALVRAAAPRLAIEAESGALYSVGDLGRVAMSWSGLDPADGDTRDLNARAGLVLVCEFGSEASAEHMTAALREAKWLTDPAPRTSNEAESLELGGNKLALERHHLSAFFLELEAWSVRDGQRWILGAGTETPEMVSARLAGRAPSLPTREKLFARESTFTPSSGTTVLRLHSDLQTVPFADALGASGLGSTLITALLPFAGARGLWRIELRGERFVTESSYVRLAASTPLEAMQGKGPVPPASTRYVPKEAVGAWVTPIAPENVGGVLAMLLLGSNVERKPSEERDRRMSAAFGRALGPNAAFSMLPITSLPVGGNGSLMPRILVTFELRDKAAFTQAFADLTKLVQEAQPKLTIEERPYHKIPITVFTPPADTGTPTATPTDNPLLAMLDTDGSKPCVVVLDDRVLITLSPTHARSEIQRFEKQRAAKDEPELHFLAAPGRIPADAVEASSLDWAGLFGKLYDVARGFAPMLAQGEALPFDPATLPSSSSFTRFFQPSFSWTKRHEHGLYTYSESSFGLETPVTIAAVIAGISRTQGGDAAGLLGGGALGQRASGGGRGQHESIGKATPDTAAGAKAPANGKPIGSVPVKDEAREKTLAALRAVKTGIAVYRSQSGRAPEKLADLLVGTENFPKGFLDPQSVPKDAWSRELRYAPDAQGPKYKLWSIGPDGVDQDGAGDDVLAP
ncbi:MAG: type II secretion system protein GspG [Planctomycetes bacterium]|nr:type II secretion system protein GspG [Planctomycetota bacterium]